MVEKSSLENLTIYLLRTVAAKSARQNRRYDSPKTGHITCKPYGLVGNVRRRAAVLPTNFVGPWRLMAYFFPTVGNPIFQ